MIFCKGNDFLQQRGWTCPIERFTYSKDTFPTSIWWTPNRQSVDESYANANLPWQQCNTMSRQTCPPEVKQPRRVCLENKTLTKVSRTEQKPARHRVKLRPTLVMSPREIQWASLRIWAAVLDGWSKHHVTSWSTLEPITRSRTYLSAWNGNTHSRIHQGKDEFNRNSPACVSASQSSIHINVVRDFFSKIKQ